MSDVLEELNGVMGYLSVHNMAGYVRSASRAKEEIERLRTDNDLWREQIVDIQNAFEPVTSQYFNEGASIVPTLAQMVGDAVADLEQLHAENERLKAHLAEIDITMEAEKERRAGWAGGKG